MPDRLPGSLLDDGGIIAAILQRILGLTVKQSKSTRSPDQTIRSVALFSYCWRTVFITRRGVLSGLVL